MEDLFSRHFRYFCLCKKMAGKNSNCFTHHWKTLFSNCLEDFAIFKGFWKTFDYFFLKFTLDGNAQFKGLFKGLARVVHAQDPKNQA